MPLLERGLLFQHGTPVTHRQPRVDADDLIAQIEKTAATIASERGKTSQNPVINHTIAIAALKFQLLKVDPKKSVLFNPEESIDFHGKTGPFIQYTHARIHALLRKYGSTPKLTECPLNISHDERNLMKKCLDYQNQRNNAGKQHNPALLANYLYDLAKAYNSYYQETQILTTTHTTFKLALSAHIANIIKKCCTLLGFTAPEEM